MIQVRSRELHEAGVGAIVKHTTVRTCALGFHIIGDHNPLAFYRAVFLRWKSVLFERWLRIAQPQSFTTPLFFHTSERWRRTTQPKPLQFLCSFSTSCRKLLTMPYDYVKQIAILIHYFAFYYVNVMMQKNT